MTDLGFATPSPLPVDAMMPPPGAIPDDRPEPAEGKAESAEPQENQRKRRRALLPDGPRQRWNARRTEIFLDTLALTCNVSEALRASGMSSSCLYRRRRDCPEFRAAWDGALDEAYSRLEVELLNRALNGETVEVINRNGEVVTIRKQSHQLGLALLRYHAVRVSAIRALHGTDHERDALSAKINMLRKLDQLAHHKVREAERKARLGKPAAARG